MPCGVVQIRQVQAKVLQLLVCLVEQKTSEIRNQQSYATRLRGQLDAERAKQAELQTKLLKANQEKAGVERRLSELRATNARLESQLEELIQQRKRNGNIVKLNGSFSSKRARDHGVRDGASSRGTKRGETVPSGS